MSGAPRSDERLAFEVVRRVLGVEVEHFDLNGRQGAVDATIYLANGNRGALEVTTCSAPGERELVSRLAKDNFTWPNPGKWWWHVEINDPSHINDVRRAYVQAIIVCEQHGVAEPADLPWRVLKYTNAIRWLLDNDIVIHGHPNASSNLRDGSAPGVMVTPGGGGGAVDEELESFQAELDRVLNLETVARRIRKVASAEGVTQRHLFLILSLDAMEFGATYGLAFGESLPPAPPSSLPSAVTHLWVATGHGNRVLLWDSESWSAHHPYGSA